MTRTAENLSFETGEKSVKKTSQGTQKRGFGKWGGGLQLNEKGRKKEIGSVFFQEGEEKNSNVPKGGVRNGATNPERGGFIKVSGSPMGVNP